MTITDLKKLFEKYTKRRSVKYALPFVLFCVCGSFGLREFADLRYKYRGTESFREKAMETGLTIKKLEEITLESEYEKIKEADLDNWENKRIPRPYGE